MALNPIVSPAEWYAAHQAHLAREKELTHLRDALNAARRALPWVKVEKPYEFETHEGRKSLAELFQGRSQLMVYHFMFGPDWQAGCPGCSFLADHLGGTLPHLEHHDVTLTAVSRAPLAKIDVYRRRMGWHFSWVSSFGTDFNHDFGVSFTPEELAKGEIAYNFQAIPSERGHDELPGLSAFFKDEAGGIYHTYSTYARGPEELLGTLMILDRAPRGRNESTTMDFVRRHDEYDTAPKAPSCCDD